MTNTLEVLRLLEELIKEKYRDCYTRIIVGYSSASSDERRI